MPAQKCSKYNIGDINHSLILINFLLVITEKSLLALPLVQILNKNDSSDDQFVPVAVYEYE